MQYLILLFQPLESAIPNIMDQMCIRDRSSWKNSTWMWTEKTFADLPAPSKLSVFSPASLTFLHGLPWERQLSERPSWISPVLCFALTLPLRKPHFHEHGDGSHPSFFFGSGRHVFSFPSAVSDLWNNTSENCLIPGPGQSYLPATCLLYTSRCV